MRSIREIIRLGNLGLSNRKVAQSVNVSPTTVAYYLNRFKASDIKYEDFITLSDDEIKEKLHLTKDNVLKKPLPDMSYIHNELKKKGVTLNLLWEEYKQENKDAYSYSQFVYFYRQFKSTLNPPMRFNHKMGEKVFVDFSGYRPTIVDPLTGQEKQVELFVGVLGSSGYTYAQACYSQNLEDWIDCHTKMFEYFGGVPEMIVPDNLKSAVVNTSLYESDINPTYEDFVIHYNTCILPARPYKPKDKSKVENGVLNAQRRILAPLRHITFFSLEELNEALHKQLKEYNQRTIRTLSQSRQDLFEKEKAFLRNLPTDRYELSYWKKAKVGLDYHVKIEDTYYSVPHKYIYKDVFIAYNHNVVKVYHNSKQIASHKRVFLKGQFVTQKEHMPKSHQYMLMPIEKLKELSLEIGPNTKAFIDKLLSNKKSPQFAQKISYRYFKACKKIYKFKA